MSVSRFRSTFLCFSMIRLNYVNDEWVCELRGVTRLGLVHHCDADCRYHTGRSGPLLPSSRPNKRYSFYLLLISFLQYKGPLSRLWCWFRRSAIECKDAVHGRFVHARVYLSCIPSLVSSSLHLVRIMLWHLANCAQQH